MATALLLFAVLVWAMVARPLRQDTASLGDEYRRLRDERRRLESRAGSLRRAEAARQQALAGMMSGRGRSLQDTRRAALASLTQAELGQVTVSVRPARLGVAEGGFQVRIQGMGAFGEAVKLASWLAGGAGGFLLEQVTFTRQGEGVSVAIEAHGLGETP